MNISYLINLKQISPQAWAKAYEGIKKITEAYPVQLMRLHTEEALGVTRMVWHHELCFMDDNSECIRLEGDALSMGYGSTYTFYKDINAQMAIRNDVDVQENPFYLSPDQEYFHCLTGPHDMNILNNMDTCGEPYTYCMLAIGIYLEHCFYENSYFVGDYNSQHIQVILPWLSQVFNEAISTPKAIEQHQLWHKLWPIYDKTSDAMTRFWFLSAQNTASKISYLLSQNQAEADAFLSQKIKGFTSVHQLGVIDLLIPYLVACQDLNALILFFKKVKIINPKPEFNLAELLKMIIGEGICDRPFENDSLGEFNKSRASLETPMESLGKMIFKMSGMPNSVDFYSNPDELIEIFAYHEPENGKLFKQIIDEHSEKTKKLRKKANDALEKRIDSLRNDTPADEAKEPWQIKRLGYTNESYFIDAAKSEYKPRPNFEETAKVVGGLIRKNLTEYKEKFHRDFIALDDRQKVLKEIYQCITDRGFALTQQAWQNIDNEPDMAILEAIFYYTNINNRELSFSNIRKHYLEHSEYWVYFK